MSQPHLAPYPRVHTAPDTSRALAWSALILGIVGTIGSPIFFLNTVTAVAAGVGVILGVIALLGTRRALAGTGCVACIGAIVFTVLVRQVAIDESGRGNEEFGSQTEHIIEERGGGSLGAPTGVPLLGVEAARQLLKRGAHVGPGVAPEAQT
ncbi:hypothetical protein ACFS2C_21205 [Prauserella oleivorans]|uniref:Uncharacterized protein n=1 Tax=Prauserella oleivorans TaxID=1478153 RepID=A0ABW5WDU4_9PSEU